ADRGRSRHDHGRVVRRVSAGGLIQFRCKVFEALADEIAGALFVQSRDDEFLRGGSGRIGGERADFSHGVGFGLRDLFLSLFRAAFDLYGKVARASAAKRWASAFASVRMFSASFSAFW